MPAPVLTAEVTVTCPANEGATISDGETRIMIDFFVVEPHSVYGGLPLAIVPQFDEQSGPFWYFQPGPGSQVVEPIMNATQISRAHPAR